MVREVVCFISLARRERAKERPLPSGSTAHDFVEFELLAWRSQLLLDSALCFFVVHFGAVNSKFIDSIHKTPKEWRLKVVALSQFAGM